MTKYILFLILFISCSNDSFDGITPTLNIKYNGFGDCQVTISDYKTLEQIVRLCNEVNPKIVTYNENHCVFKEKQLNFKFICYGT